MGTISKTVSAICLRRQDSSTGISVSQVALGAATFGVAPTAERTDRLVGEALDLGDDDKMTR